MPDIEIMTGPMPPGGGALTEVIALGEEADQRTLEERAPTGPFKPKAVNAMVKAMNRVLPLFGLDPDARETTEARVDALPVELVRHLDMISAAANDAVAAEAIDAELAFSLSDITDDTSLQVVSGKLDKLSKDKDFKTFLKEAEAQPEAEAEVTEVEVEETPDGDEVGAEDLFMERM